MTTTRTTTATAAIPLTMVRSTELSCAERAAAFDDPSGYLLQEMDGRCADHARQLHDIPQIVGLGKFLCLVEVREVHDDGDHVGIVHRLKNVVFCQTGGFAHGCVFVIERLPGGKILHLVMDHEHSHDGSPSERRAGVWLILMRG